MGKNKITSGGNIGLGTFSNPNNSRLTIYSNINVGFGVTCPKEKLNIKK